MTSPYVELRCKSAFSFLTGASLPEALVERAAELGYTSLAIADRAGLYAAPRLHKAAQKAGLHPIYGAEVLVEDRPLLLLCEDARGYRNLCRLITRTKQVGAGAEGASLRFRDLEAEGQGLFALSGGSEGTIGSALQRGDYEEADHAMQQLVAALGRDHIAAELQLHFDEEEDRRNAAVVQLGRSHGLPLVLTNDVRMATPEQQLLCDALTCVREGVQLERAGTRLLKNGERFLKSPHDMALLLPDLPQAVENSAAIAERCRFSMKELSYRFPDFPLPHGEDQAAFLRAVVFDAAPARFRPLDEKARNQLERELRLIEQLGLSGYFLIVWDIIQFCKSRGILVQGRGSAANSAVCFALGITAVDPLKMNLLFERFLSEERGEWPDIDLDLPSGSRREEVIQYLYRKYGSHACALTAVVITYRERSALRDLGKALGFDKGALDRIARHLHHYGAPEDEASDGNDADTSENEVSEMTLQPELEITRALREAGMESGDRRVIVLQELWAALQELPRHIGQHPGGMVIAAGRLDEVVPLEPARMAGRVVLQWDKDDCADVGMVKIDLLGLGMMAALEDATRLVPEHDGASFDIAALPPDDPAVYELLKRADTIGLFQVESRAQQRVLQSTKPDRFYDLVVQVGLIRPGPIVGKMVGPYIRRRIGKEPVSFPHPSLADILLRTLGVPLFQEQVMKMAMVAAGFTGGQAELLRRAMDSKRGDTRKEARMRELVGLLREGMQRKGIDAESAAQIEHAITSFAQYGFPESHAISFAILAYASAYLKAHHPAVFYTSLLNAWPMGFYHPLTLLHDARRRGVRVLPIDVNRSEGRCTIEHPPDADHYHWSAELPRNVVPLAVAAVHQQPVRGPAGLSGEPPPSRVVRLGLRFVRGLSRRSAEALVQARKEAPFTDLADVKQRCPELTQPELATLAEIGAFAGLPGQPTRREALWQASQLAQSGGPLLQKLSDEESPLEEMSLAERVAADLEGTGISVGPHPLRFAREILADLQIVTAAQTDKLPHGARVKVAGLVIVRQRPATAAGAFFLTLEDETGLHSVTVSPQDFSAMRPVLISATGLIIHGTIDVREGARSIRCQRCQDLGQVLNTYGTPLDVQASARSFC